jgi:hypothetical protein
MIGKISMIRYDDLCLVLEIEDGNVNIYSDEDVPSSVPIHKAVGILTEMLSVVRDASK